MKLITFFIMINLFSLPIFAKIQCESYFNKLQNIQALQRKAHSASASVSLQNRERDAFLLWQRCKKGKIVNKTSKSKKQTKLVNVKKTQVKKIITLVPGSAFATEKAVIMKADYRGEMQQAWLNYYQSPKKCLQPKSTQIFAFCMEDRYQQKLTFEKELAFKINNR
jgi:hypothetical protein